MRHPIQKRMTGLQAILATPFHENGDVDYDGLHENVKKLISKGIRWITCTGHCGEFAALTYEEYAQVLRTVGEAAKGSGALFVPSANAHSLRTLLRLCGEAQKAGADAVMIAPPFYSPCSFESAKAFFGEVLKNCRLPVELYYYPQLHRMSLSVQQLTELLSMECFAAVKETSCDVVTFTQVCARIGGEVNVITGAGEYLVPDIMPAGGSGFISTFVNYAPEIPLSIWRALERGDYAAAAGMRAALTPLFTAMSRYGSLHTIKLLMDAFGYRGGSVRLPERPVIAKGEELRELIRLVGELKENPLFAQ